MLAILPMIRYLDTAPYNSLNLTCTVDVHVLGQMAPSSIRFQWLHSIGLSPPSALPAGAFTNPTMLGATATSVLTLPTQNAGTHIYYCEVQLDVAPALDNISSTQELVVEVTG